MNWRDLSINNKIGLIFSVQLAIVIIIGSLAYLKATTIEKAIYRTEHTTLALTETASQMNVDIIQIQQWLTDISATRGLDGLNDGFDEAEKSYKSFQTGLSSFRAHFEQTGNREGLRTVSDLEARVNNYYATGKKMAQAYIDQGPAGGNKMMASFDEAAESLSASLDPFLEAQKKSISSDLESVDQSMSQVASASAILALVSITFLGATLLFLARSISGALNQSVKIANKLKDGDLGFEISISSRDECGQMLSALKEMTDRLRNTITLVNEGSHIISNGAMEIAQGNANLSQRTEEQASSLEETASSMEEMTGTVKQNADSAAEAKQLADANRQRAAVGAEVVHRTVNAMSEINESSTRIADIIGTIDGIAFQTNLLALNAAVEAARAGEQGRGFAVVASEVRSLAQRSAEAAKEIKDLIEDSVGKVRAGTALVDESGKTLEDIIQGTQKVADIIAEIAAASLEQASGIDQVNNAITQMDNMTQDNAALVEEQAAASRSMEEQANLLTDRISFFKVDGGVQTGRLRSSGAANTGQHKDSAPKKNQPAGQARLESRKPAKPTPSRDDTSEWEQF